MLLLAILLVVGAKCCIFPPASYRIDNNEVVPGYPQVIGFFSENHVDKLGAEIYGYYYTYDCTGKDRKIYRSGKTVVEYRCTANTLFLGVAYFELDAYFPVRKQNFSAFGGFIHENRTLVLNANNAVRTFSIETDNGSTRKSFPRALYRLRDPKNVADGLPPEIGFFRENDVDSLSIELNKFYYIYTCDNRRHFHYENKKLINTYVCFSLEFFGISNFDLSVEIRQPRTEIYSFGAALGQNAQFLLNGKTVGYVSTSGVAEKPITPSKSDVNPDLERKVQDAIREAFNLVKKRQEFEIGYPADFAYYIAIDGVGYAQLRGNIFSEATRILVAKYGKEILSQLDGIDVDALLKTVVGQHDTSFAEPEKSAW